MCFSPLQDIDIPCLRKKYVLHVSVVDRMVWICTAGAGLWVYNAHTRQPVASWGEEERQQVYTLLHIAETTTTLALTHKGMYVFASDFGLNSQDQLYPTHCIPRAGRELSEGIVIPAGANLKETECWVCTQNVLGFTILDPLNFDSLEEVQTASPEGLGHQIRHLATTVLDERRVLLVADKHVILYWDVVERLRYPERDFDCSEACKSLYNSNGECSWLGVTHTLPIHYRGGEVRYFRFWRTRFEIFNPCLFSLRGKSLHIMGS